jgi:pimeloyl-ACP methyl ester carboxylesterase
MNGKTEGDRFVLDLDVAGLRAMLEDYFAVDLMHVFAPCKLRTKTHLVLGGRSSLLSAADREHLVHTALANPSCMSAHVIHEAGHDVHMDRPEQLLNLIAADL